MQLFYSMACSFFR